MTPTARQPHRRAALRAACGLLGAAIVLAGAPGGSVARAAGGMSSAPRTAIQGPDHAPPAASIAALPLAFEQNVGQTDAAVDFLARGSGYTVFLAGGDAVLSLKHGPTSSVVRLSLVGGRADPTASGEEQLAGRSNYLIGSLDQWHTDIANYGAVRYRQVYDGIDLRYLGNRQELEYDFLVNAGADPKAIRLAFQGIANASVDPASGDLVLALEAGGPAIRFHAPVAYQDGPAGRAAVESRYAINDDGTVGFRVGRYDTSRALVIDPTLMYGSYFGGTSTDYGSRVAVDASGNIYILGQTSSSDFPATNGSFGGGSYDAYVMKLAPNGGGTADRVFATYIGGNGSEYASGSSGGGIYVNSSSQVIIAGGTTSSNFPTTTGAYHTYLNGSSDAFVVKLSASGSSVLYGTYVGSTGGDTVAGMRVNSSGQVYITGQTTGSGLPLKNAYQSSLKGTSDAYVVGLALNGGGSADLIYGTYLGGTNPSSGEWGDGLDFDSAGNVYVVGYTPNSDHPVTTGAFKTTLSGLYDGYLTKLNPNVSGASGLVYSTYIGGTSTDEATDVSVDRSTGDVYVTGWTLSNDMTTSAGAYDTAASGSKDVFVYKIHPGGLGSADLLYGTYLGGAGSDQATQLVRDASGRVYVVGYAGTGFPLVNPIQASYGGSTDAFVATLQLNGSGSSDLLFSTYLGGTSTDQGNGLAVDSNGNLYAVGYSASTGFPVTTGAFATTNRGIEDGFVVKLHLGLAIDLDADDSSGASGANFITRFLGAGAVAIADSDATLTNDFGSNMSSLTVTITNRLDGANEVLAATTAGTSITASYSSSTGVLTLSGTDTVAHYQQVLRTVTYNNSAGSPSLTDRSITFVGTSGSDTSNTATTTVKLANLPPVNTVPAAQTANYVGTLVFSTANGNAISTSDPDAGTSAVQVTLTATGGTLTLSGTTGLTFSAGDGTADATMTFTGTLTNINAALDGLTFNGDPFRSSGTGSVQIVTNDLGHTGLGGAQSDTDSVTVNMVPLGTPYMISGTYAGTAGTLNITGLGFQPDVVIVKRITGATVAVIKTSTMAGAASKAMTGATATGTGDITSLNADGFTVVNTTGNANASGQTFTWIAFKASAGVMRTGTYTGTGSAGLAVTGLGFSPELVFVMDASTQAAVFRSSNDTNSYDFTMNKYTTAVTALGADGFTLGNAAQANTFGHTYHYVAFNDISGLMKVGGYTGNGVDNSNIAAVGFAPEWLMVQSSSGTDPAVHHTEAQGASTDTSNYFTAATSAANIIQALQADGFQVGTNAAVNTNLRAYSYMAWRQETGPTITAINSQSTLEDTSLGPIAFTIGDAETAAASLFVKAVSSNQALVPDANLVLGGSGTSRTLTLTPAANANGSATVTVYVSDGEAQASTTFTLTVTAVNDAPVRTAGSPSAINVDEDSANSTAVTLGLGALTYGPGGGSDEAGQTLTYKVTAIPAYITLYLADGTTQVTANTTVTLAQLQGLKYKTVPNGNGSGNLTWTVQDNGGTSNGGFDTLTENLAITVTAVNDAPTLVGGTVTLTGTNEDTTSGATLVSAILTSAGWADVDSGALSGIAVTARTGNGTWQYSTDGVTWAAFGSVSGTSALLLTSSSRVRYVPDAMNGETATFTFVAWDQTTETASTNATPSYANPGAGGGTTAFSTATATSSITVTSVNDAPVLDNSRSPALTAENEDPGSPSGAVGTLVSSLVDFAVPAGQVDNVTDVDTGPLLGIAVTAADTSHGSWYYSTDGGTTWLALGAVAATSARLLAADANTRLFFLPAANWNGTLATAITLRAWDQTSWTNGSLADTSTNGGTTAFSTATDTASLVINPVNDPPVAVNDSVSCNEGRSCAFGSRWVLMNDTDVDGDTLTAVLVTGPSHASAFTLNSDGSFTYTHDGTETTSDSFTYQAYDGQAYSNVATVFMTINPMNDPPVNAVPGNQTMNEDGSLVFSSANGNAISISDPDAGSGQMLETLSVSHGALTLSGTSGLTFSVGDGTADATMTFTGTMAGINAALAGLTYAPTADYNGSDTLTITTNDQGNTGGGGALSDTDYVSITVRPVNDAPVNTVPVGQYTALNTAKVFSTGNGNRVSISDVDALGGSEQLSLTVGHGTLTLSGTTGLTFGSGANGSATMTFTGTLTNINTALNGLSYAPTTGYRGLDQLAVVSNDLGNTGSGGALGASSTVTLWIGAVVVTNTNDLSNGTTTSISALAANDGGDGVSLREAISAANNTVGTDYIYFGISGGGVHTIATASALPTISEAVVLDGTTQSGYAGTPLIDLDGNAAGAGVSGLTVSATGSTISGLAIERFRSSGLVLTGGSTTVTGNYIGTDPTGAIARGNLADGVLVQSSGNTIGGTTTATRNVISANSGWGILLDGAAATGNQVLGNYLGTNAAGTAALGNGMDGVKIQNAANNNHVGNGTTSGRNLISANRNAVVLQAVTGTVIQGNYIGTDAAGTANLGNQSGVYVFTGASGNLIGGTSTGQGNLIRFSPWGVQVDADAGTGNAILGNQISDCAPMGIELGADGVTANDTGDGDTGPNNLQNFPVLAAATTDGSRVGIVGSLNSTANSYFRIEFFSGTAEESTGYGEGATYLGYTQVTTDGSGNASFTASLAASVTAGSYVSATATKSDATFSTYTDTSEFAQDVIAAAPAIMVTPLAVTPLGAETRVNTTTTDVQAIQANVNQAVATDASGNFVVTWSSNAQDGSGYGVYAQRFGADGTALGSEFRVNTTTADAQILPSVAMDAAGDFVVTWSSNAQDGSGYGVYAQRYNAAGVAQGGEFLVNTTTAGSQYLSAIAMAPSGGFVIAWMSGAQDPDASAGIYAQRYNASGVPQGGEFRVNTYTSNTQFLPSAAMDTAGDFVVTWASDGQDGSTYGVYGQRYNAAGVAQGTEFRVNTTTANSQLYNDVAMLPDGRFVVAYQSRNGDGSYEMYMQRYAANGTPVGSEIHVNAATVESSTQPIPSIAADAGGTITVVWNSTADGSGAGVVGRRFYWSGSPVAGEFAVNTTTTGDQLYPEVAAQPGGRFVVAWGGNGPGDADGVFFERYGLATTEAGTTAMFQVGLTSVPTANVPTLNVLSISNLNS